MSEETDQNTAEERLDLSRFEGHTPAPWHEILMQGDEYNNGYDDLQERGFNEAAQDLIAAAPDLLAEVERLRDLVDFAIAAIDSNQCYMGEEEQADLLNHLRLSRDSERTEWSENED